MDGSKSAEGSTRKRKMTLRQRFYNWLMDPMRNEPADPVPMRKDDLDVSGIVFHFYPATGGTVIKVRRNDMDDGPRVKATSEITTMHVVPADDDLPEAVAKIVSLELLRNR